MTSRCALQARMAQIVDGVIRVHVSSQQGSLPSLNLRATIIISEGVAPEGVLRNFLVLEADFLPVGYRMEYDVRHAVDGPCLAYVHDGVAIITGESS